MKNIFLKSIAFTLLATSSLVHAQFNDAGIPVDQQIQPSDSGKVPFPLDGQNSEKGIDPGLYYLYFSASAGAPVGSTGVKTYSGAGCVYMTGSSDMDVSLQLPDGHSIRGYRYYWDDTSASSTSALLWTFDGAGGLTLVDTLTSTGDAGFGSAYADLTDGDLLVDNFSNAFTIRFRSNSLTSDQKMCGIRIAMVAP